MDVRAFVGLGANLGDREGTLRAGLDRLAAEPGIRLVAVSGFRETEPWGLVDQPGFVNAACELATSLDAHELLRRLLAIEAELGRTRDGPRWGPRTLDLDLLLYGDEEIADPPVLEVPHPRLVERRFALEPLVELDPDLALPDGRSLRGFLAELE